MTPDSYCLNCHAALAGRWCQSCGQKRLEPEDRKLKSLMGEFVSELTNLDGRVLRSFTWLIIRPGRLASDYLRGVRKRYLSPVALFLLANVAFFFAPTLTDFAQPLRSHVSVQPYSGIAKAMVNTHLSAAGVSFEKFETQFEQRQNDIAKTLLFLHIPILALGLLLLHFRRDLLLADHALVACYVMAFVMLHSLLTPRLLGLFASLFTDPASLSMATRTWILRIGLIAPLLAWLYFLLRGAFAQPAWLAALKVPLVFGALIVTHLLYRAALFFIVFAVA